MNINSVDGSITFASGPICRDTKRTEFLESPIGNSAKNECVNGNRSNYEFDPEPGVRGTIFFSNDRLDRVFLMMSMPSDARREWTEQLELARKANHDQWLAAELGRPPYEYSWGRVVSDFDPRGCASEIIVVYES